MTLKEDLEIREVGMPIQQHYMEIENCVDDATLCIVNGLIQLLQETQEYQCRHGFAEGWRMDKEASKKSDSTL